MPENVTQNVVIYNGRYRRWGFPFLACIGFVIAFFWPLGLPGFWKLLEIAWLGLIALIWGIGHGIAVAARNKKPEPPAWQPPGPRDYPGTTLL